MLLLDYNLFLSPLFYDWGGYWSLICFFSTFLDWGGLIPALPSFSILLTFAYSYTCNCPCNYKQGVYYSELDKFDNHISFNNMFCSCSIFRILNTIEYPALRTLHWRSSIYDFSFILSHYLNLLLSPHTVFFCHLTSMDMRGSYKSNNEDNIAPYKYLLLYTKSQKKKEFQRTYSNIRRIESCITIWHMILKWSYLWYIGFEYLSYTIYTGIPISIGEGVTSVKLSYQVFHSSTLF